MSVTIQNIPYLSLIWIGMGFLLVLIGILRLAYNQSQEEKEDSFYKGQSELFAYFLQEEEKKNDKIRESFSSIEQVEPSPIEDEETVEKSVRQPREDVVFEEIIRQYEKNVPLEEIAKHLKIGIGEVKLIVSLYAMR